MSEAQKKINLPAETSTGPASQPDLQKDNYSPDEQKRFNRIFNEHWRWAVWQAAAAGVPDPEFVALGVLNKAMVAYDENRAKFRTWLTRLLFCAIVDTLRKEGRRRTHLNRLAELAALPGNHQPPATVAFEHRDWVQAAIIQLPTKDRQLIQDYYEEEMSLRQIASRS